MEKVAVIYHSYQGVTERMVKALKEGIEDEGGEADLLRAREAGIADLLESDGFVLASGQPFGTLSGPVKSFLEELWLAEEKEKLEEKPYTYLLNGNELPDEAAERLKEIGGYFDWDRILPGVKIKGSEVEDELARCKKLGKELVS